MNYPHHLLPLPHFKFISWHESLNDKFLLRHTPSVEILDAETSKIKPSCVALQSDHLRDLSMNLFGTFCPEDRFLRILEARKDYFTGLWQPGEQVDAPLFPEDFDLDETRGKFFLKISDVQGLEIAYNVGEQAGFSAICQVLHTPVRSNFWHFSLRWFNREGDISEQQGAWKRRVFTAARALIAEFGSLGLPDTLPLEPALFQK